MTEEKRSISKHLPAHTKIFFFKNPCFLAIRRAQFRFARYMCCCWKKEVLFSLFWKGGCIDYEKLCVCVRVCACVCVCYVCVCACMYVFVSHRKTSTLMKVVYMCMPHIQCNNGQMVDNNYNNRTVSQMSFKTTQNLTDTFVITISRHSLNQSIVLSFKRC